MSRPLSLSLFPAAAVEEALWSVSFYDPVWIVVLPWWWFSEVLHGQNVCCTEDFSTETKEEIREHGVGF